jgi:hypothetical protein
MAMQLSVAARNARLDAIETTAGASAVLKIFTGSPPANCAAADSGTDMTVNSTRFTAEQSFTVNSFTLTDANA